jgi:pyrroloquinoline-quinone synthase
MDLARFESVGFLPGAARYRAFLDDAVQRRGWAVGAAIVTLFVEGTPYERGEIDESAPRRPSPPLSEHPLVQHYGLPISALELTRVHRQVEGSHRASAWRMMLDHVPPTERAAVVEAMEAALALWLAYRDDVALSCGLRRGVDGSAVLAG